MSIKILLSYLSAFFLLGAPGDAWAGFVGNDTSNFNPIPSGLDFITVHSSRTLSAGYLNTNLFFNQATNSLPDTRNTSGQIIGTDDRMIFADWGTAFGITDHLEAAISLSYLLDQDTDRTEPGAQFAGTGLNEIKLLGKYALYRGPSWGSAVVISMNINHTEHNPFVGSGGGPTTNIEAVIDYHQGNSVTALNAGYRFRHKGQNLPLSVYDPIGDQTIASIATSYYLTALDTKIVGEIWASKLMESTVYESSSDISSEALFGFKLDAGKHAALQAGGGTRLGQGLFTPDWRMYLGLSLTWDLLQKSTEQDVVSHSVPLPNAPENMLESTAEPKVVVEVIRLENLDFEFGSSKIQPKHYALLNHVIDLLVEKPNIKKITVEGHTDSVGSAERNRKRSQERADNVRNYLKSSRRLDNLKIESIGYGSDRPIAENSSFQGRSLNRRVEVRIMRNLD